MEPPEETHKTIEGMRRDIKSAVEQSSSYGEEVLPSVRQGAPLAVQKNWRYYACGRHKAPDTMNVVSWNRGHPVVCGNALLVVICLATICGNWDTKAWWNIPKIQMGLGLGLLDYYLCRWWLRRHPFKLDPVTQWVKDNGFLRRSHKNSWW